MTEITTNQLYKMIQEAQKKAFEEHINANMIIINENLIKVPQFTYGTNIGGFQHAYSCPPMICGLEVHVTKDDLPKNISFSLVEGSRQIDKIISRKCKKTAEDILNKVKDFLIKNSCLSMNTFAISVTLDECNRELDKLAKEFGIEVEE